ncbi:MAG TPA: DEAD/DEAH box helicase [Verrucomicrobiota bacterium]|nr:DEAD/DEAH box helicase [Verrucomicrobiota bacterium]
MSLVSFADLAVPSDVQKVLERLGFEAPVPVQTAVLTALKSSRSAVIAAPARSGRGTALALAAATLASSKGEPTQVLVLTGTRSRAFQLSDAVRTFVAGRKSVTVAPWVFGPSAERQSALAERGATVVVGTPGVLRQAVHDGKLKLDQVTAVLIDSADEQLDVGLEEDVEALLAAAPESRLVIALATILTRELEALAVRRFPEADRLVPEPPATAPALTWFSVDSSEKFLALTVLMDRHQLKGGLVFTNDRLSADELAGRLTAVGYPAECVTSDVSASVRDRALKRFRQGAVLFLVGSVGGLASVEVDPVPAIIHFDWPLDESEFVKRHERLHAGGVAFAFASGRELIRARAVSRRGSPVRLGRLPLTGELAEQRLQANVSRLREALGGRNPAACRSVVDLLMAEGFEPAVIAGAAIRLLGTPELPTLPPPLPPPVVSSNESSPVAVAELREDLAPAPVSEASGDDQSDWSPGVGATEEVAPTSSEGDASGYETGEPGYAYSDNAAEDGVVYPPGANFGDDETGTSPGGDDRAGRRGRRGGRGRGAGRGGEGGPTASGMKRLWLNVGRMDRIQPRDIVGCILGETGLPSVAVGRVQLFERHTLVDVSGSFESQILEALNRAAVRGRKLKAKIAAY